MLLLVMEWVGLHCGIAAFTYLKDTSSFLLYTPVHVLIKEPAALQHVFQRFCSVAQKGLRQRRLLGYLQSDIFGHLYPCHINIPRP